MSSHLVLAEEDFPAADLSRRVVVTAAAPTPDSASAIGLPVKNAWLFEYIEDTAIENDELAMTGYTIGWGGGFATPPVHVDDTNVWVWPVTNPDDALDLTRDLRVTGTSETDRRFPVEQFYPLISDPAALLLAARSAGSRRASGSLGFRRDVRLDTAGTAHYDISILNHCVGGNGAAAAALRACFGRQVKADLATLTHGLRHAGGNRVLISCRIAADDLPWLPQFQQIISLAKGELENHPAFKAASTPILLQLMPQEAVEPAPVPRS